MNSNERGQLPSDVARGRSRFQAWREKREPGSRIPQDLWDMAVGLARIHGVSRTATVLGLDYYGLRKRVEAAVARPQATSTSFVELPSPIRVGKECRLELDNGTGAIMRVHLVGYEAADVAAVSRSFWDAL
jgi:hypothetical protein